MILEKSNLQTVQAGETNLTSSLQPYMYTQKIATDYSQEHNGS